MNQSSFVTIKITTNQTIELNNVTVLEVIQDISSTELLYINNSPVLDRREIVLIADGNFTENLILTIEFKPSNVPVTNPISLIYLRYKKLITNNCLTNGG